MSKGRKSLWKPKLRKVEVSEKSKRGPSPAPLFTLPPVVPLIAPPICRRGTTGFKIPRKTTFHTRKDLKGKKIKEMEAMLLQNMYALDKAVKKVASAGKHNLLAISAEFLLPYIEHPTADQIYGRLLSTHSKLRTELIRVWHLCTRTYGVRLYLRFNKVPSYQMSYLLKSALFSTPIATSNKGFILQTDTKPPQSLWDQDRELWIILCPSKYHTKVCTQGFRVMPWYEDIIKSHRRISEMLACPHLKMVNSRWSCSCIPLAITSRNNEQTIHRLSRKFDVVVFSDSERRT